MPAASDRTAVNSFGYFLETVQETPAKTASASASRAAAEQSGGGECVTPNCDDPQLTILRALTRRDGPTCALDLMKDTRLAPTVLLGTLQVMREFGLVKLVEAAPGDAGGQGAAAPQVVLTPCGRKAVEIYQG